MLSAPLWIPAFAGMTEVGAGNDGGAKSSKSDGAGCVPLYKGASHAVLVGGMGARAPSLPRSARVPRFAVG